MTTTSMEPGTDEGYEQPPEPSKPNTHRMPGRFSPDRLLGWMSKVPVPASRLPKLPRKPVSAVTAADRLTIWSLIAFGALTAWLLFYALVVSSLQHSHDQGVLYSRFREAVGNATAPIGGVIKPDTPVALIDFPAAGLHHEVVVEGTAPGDLVMGPGHRRDTPLPGQPGDAVVYGRDKLFGGPFHGIASVQPGDTITVTTGEGVAKFVVQRVRHAGDTYPRQVGSAYLTLETAQATGWRSAWAPTRVVYVDAVLQGTPFGDNGGRPAAVPKAELAMKNDPSALNLLVLWLPVVVVGALAAVWAHQHWGVWQTWLVCVPVVLAGLWGVSQNVLQLLPNLT